MRIDITKFISMYKIIAMSIVAILNIELHWQ
jgi:hypothetical protein